VADVLKEICDQRRLDVQVAKREKPISALQADIKAMPSPRGFAQALSEKVNNDQIGLIAEVKRASPSQGEIRKDFDPVACAKTYEMAGATCLSVLTEPNWFQGSPQDLENIRGTVTLPLLRKDFTIDPYQVVEARNLGADCILLIMAALSENQAMELAQTAREYDLDILVEVHNHEERDRALNSGMPFDLLGVNNRNLKTMDINIETTVKLTRDLPPGILSVCESGIQTTNDIRYIRKHGTHCFLIGTALMKQDDLYNATQTILNA
tara:strand:- start:1300 stop:2097 length:798 start_codon:yes stop_codon:yes gene_type:complete